MDPSFRWDDDRINWGDDLIGMMIESMSLPATHKKPRCSGVQKKRESNGDQAAGSMFDACAPFGPWVSS